MNPPPITAGQLIEGSSISEIIVRFVPEGDVRHGGVGDWFCEGDVLHIRASGETSDEAFLIALHELVEAWLCRRQGVPEAAVDAHDLRFEDERQMGLHDAEAEPGDDPRAIYRKQHRRAMILEHLMANFLGLHDYGEIR